MCDLASKFFMLGKEQFISEYAQRSVVDDAESISSAAKEFTGSALATENNKVISNKVCGDGNRAHAKERTFKLVANIWIKIYI